jgi:hypothetical protein
MGLRWPMKNGLRFSPGRRAWNGWRKQNPNTLVDLSEERSSLDIIGSAEGMARTTGAADMGRALERDGDRERLRPFHPAG